MLRRLIYVAVFAWAAFAQNANLSGIWTGQTTDRNGDPQDFSFRFEQRGNVLQGKLYGDNESTAITEGSLNGDRVSFCVTTELNGSISKTLFTGTLTGGEMKLVRERVGGNPAATAKTPEKPAPKLELTLKRLT